MRRLTVFHIPFIQTAVLLLVGALCSLNQLEHGVAVVLGGLIAILPHGYFTLYAFRFRGARAAARIADAFKRGETGKFALTMVGFACVFALLPVSRQYPSWVFGGYGAMLLLQIVLAGLAVKDD